MGTAARVDQISQNDYLSLERAAATKSEFYEGRIYAMAGTSRSHNLIVANLSRVIGNELVDRPCELYLADMRVRISPDVFTYPDVVIVCGEPAMLDNEFDTLLNPTAIVEILSPSTESWDRGGKFTLYQTLPSLRDYILIAQDQMRVEHHSRGDAGWALVATLTGPADVLRIESVGVTVPLAAIYARVRLDPVAGS